MEEHDIDYYLDSFSKLRRASLQGHKAPHKPILLLAIIRLIDEGIITSTRIELSNSLIDAFTCLWKLHIGNGQAEKHVVNVAEGLDLELSRPYPFKCSIENPFYFMSFEPFWSLQKTDNYVKHNQYTLKAIRKSFAYAEIDEDLFNLMQSSSKTILQNFLIDIIEKS